MRLVVLDTETTGMDETDQVCELALVSLHLHENRAHELRRYTTLIRPSCPVSPEARAAHHISDAELESAPTMERILELSELTDGGLAMLRGADAVAAHHAEFDLRMLRQSGVPDSMLPSRVVCTYQCSRHLWPTAKHSNQSLRYMLELDPPVEGAPHRALPDAMVTTWLLLEMLRTKTVDELIELTRTPVLEELVRVTKQRGRPWSEMDVGFLRWILKRDFDPDTVYAAQHWLDVKMGRRQP